MGQFSEMFEEMGVKKSTIFVIIALNILRILSVFAAVVFVVLWIITTNPVFGWALLGAAVFFILVIVFGILFGSLTVMKL